MAQQLVIAVLSSIKLVHISIDSVCSVFPHFHFSMSNEIQAMKLNMKCIVLVLVMNKLIDGDPFRTCSVADARPADP